MTTEETRLHAISGRKEGGGGSARARRQRRRAVRQLTVMLFAVLVLTVAGLAFVYKMTEFAMTIVKDEVEGFGAVAISLYLLGLLPIIFLTLWAVLTGRFRDIERPKFRLLELDREIERGGDLGRRHV
jgi:hypothetical protein